MAEIVRRKGGKREEETLEVVCRIAPYRGTNHCDIALDDETEEKNYKFAYVFDGNDTQRDVFNRCAADFICDLVNGRNSLLFTYVPGFGSGCVAAVFVSYVEIYNNYCYDLLDQSLTDNRVGESKQVRTPTDGPAYVDRLTEVEVQSSNELLMQYMRGQARRNVGKTLLNQQSSRSHSIFTVRLVMAQEDKDGQPIIDGSKPVNSQVFFVDLEGSECTKRTGNILKRFDETCKINESLLVLRRCFEALRKNQRARRQAKPVPYRDQKLTLLFKSFFEGHGRVRMIVCLNPQPSDYE